ncbi:MAG: hypothetical protein MUE66_03740 [Acidimicrobiia bacterium]|nr:hypothetical protein [Acidimicrobiia bacterium]
MRPVLEGEPSRRPRWQAAGAVALGLVVLSGVLWLLGRDRPVEEATVTSTLAAASTTASTTTTVPASALEGIVVYVADGCADCPVLESTLRGLAGEVPVWVRPADGTMSLLPTVVVQFDGRVSARWVGRGAVNHPEAIAAFAGARWPTGTIPPTTTTTTTTAIIPLTIVAAPITPEDAYPCSPCPLAAVSDREVWASMISSHADLIGHLKDGVWAIYRFESLDGLFHPSALAVAPDGTVWAATTQGVFSFEGGVGTRRLDHPASGVAVAPDGTVWIGGLTDEGQLWLARWDGESWVRVDPAPRARMIWGGVVPMAVSSDGAVWIGGGHMVEPGLMRYDGATMEPVPVGDYQPGEFRIFRIEAAPNGDLWIGGDIPTDDASLPLLARFDGEEWTTYDPPFSWSGGDIAVGPDGVVWFAADGLWSFDGTDWTVRIEGQPVWAVDVAPDGTVWYADEQGVHTLSTP